MVGESGKFCIGHGKTVLEMHKTLRTACIVTAVGRTQTCDCFSWFKHGKIVVEDCECAGCPVTGHPHRNKKNSHNRRLIVWNMPVKSHGRFQCVVDLHEEVCASVAHQWAAAGASFSCWKHSCGPYSPDTVPCNLFLFPRMKLPLWRYHWHDIWKTGTIIDCYVPFQRVISSGASFSCRNAESFRWIWWGSTMKGTAPISKGIFH